MLRPIFWTKTIGVFLLSLALIVSCKKNPPASSSTKDIGCAGNYLGQFIEGIPLPGFSLLGKFGGKIVGNVAGILKGKAASESKSTCGAPATFSDQQMQQMKQAIKDGFSDQNHMEAKALMNKIDTKLANYVADEDRFSSYTMTNLQSIIDDTNDWWSKYDQSGTRIYNVQDFIIVTGFSMSAYQQQIREVALEANQSKTAGDAKKVRDYAAILGRQADHARKELEEISNIDIEGVTKSFWKNEGKTQTKQYFTGDLANAHCYESSAGSPYSDLENAAERPAPRTEKFLAGMRATKTLTELSDYVSKNGTVCCMDSSCGDLDIENRIKLYIEETNKQVKQVMFFNDSAIMKYFNETLPLFINVSQMLSSSETSDDIIFQLAEKTEYSGNSSVASGVFDGGVAKSMDGGATGGDGSSCPGNKDCKDGWGWLNNNESGCTSSSSTWKGNGCSCKCSGAGVSSGSTTGSTGGDGSSCPGNKDCKDGWGWLNNNESGCTSSSSTWKGNGCSCKCSGAGASSGSTTGSTGGDSCPGNKYCKDGWGWLNNNESGCTSSSSTWKGNGCSCKCSGAGASSGSTTGSTGGDGSSCPGNKDCKDGWGWLNNNESGCTSSSSTWKGNGCSCKC